MPFECFQKVNNESKAAQAKRIADEKAQCDALAEQDKHKERVETYEKAVGEMLTTRMAGVPEHISKLLTGMDPLAALKRLGENAEQLGRKLSPKTDASKSGDQKGDDTFSKAHIDKGMSALGF